MSTTSGCKDEDLRELQFCPFFPHKTLIKKLNVATYSNFQISLQPGGVKL